MTLKKSEWSNWKSTLIEYKTVVAEFSSVCTYMVSTEAALVAFTYIIGFNRCRHVLLIFKVYI